MAETPRGKTIAVVQARMTSTRLPGKVMMPVLGKPLLGYELERAARAERLSAVVVATTVNASDDAVARYAESLGFGVYRGPEDDVLERYHGAALAFGAENVARLTADCPLIDPVVVDRVVEALTESGPADYASDFLGRRTYPRGLDAEAFTFSALDRAWREASLPSEREHVTPYLYNHPEIFKLRGVYNETDLSRYRWTVDTPEDFTLVKALLEGVYPSHPDFSFENILDFMVGNPALFEVNCHVKQKS
jgi:spore coat polysaccharide biosynthesis protein SpsF